MSSMRAIQLVKKLLEYGLDPDAPRPGSPDDPWRQSTGPIKFRRGDFDAVRPNQPPPPVPTEIPDDAMLEPDDLLDAPPEPVGPPGPPATPPTKPENIPVKNVHPRFKWRPPPPPGP